MAAEDAAGEGKTGQTDLTPDFFCGRGFDHIWLKKTGDNANSGRTAGNQGGYNDMQPPEYTSCGKTVRPDSCVPE